MGATGYLCSSPQGGLINRNCPDVFIFLGGAALAGDLKPCLSRDILKKGRPDRNDGLLNAWGIQHLHLRTPGTDQLLFCMITDTIKTLPHNDKHLWSTDSSFKSCTTIGLRRLPRGR